MNCILSLLQNTESSSPMFAQFDSDCTDTEDEVYVVKSSSFVLLSLSIVNIIKYSVYFNFFLLNPNLFLDDNLYYMVLYTRST